jgi:uncharacterized protein YcbX
MLASFVTAGVPRQTEGKVTALHYFPVKSLRHADECVQDSVVLGPRGVSHDREWMVVLPGGQFITQRDYPSMATVGTVRVLCVPQSCIVKCISLVSSV